MATDKKATTLRLSDRHRDILDRLATDSGLSKNAVIELLLEKAHNTQSDVTLAKASFDRTLNLNGSDVTTPKSDITLKGLDAERAILDGRKVDLGDGDVFLYLNGWLWVVSKTANGSQKIIGRYRECPSFIADELVRAKPCFDKLKSALENWELVKGLEYIDRIGWGNSCYPMSLAEALFYHLPECILEEALTRIERYKASLETTAAVEVVKNEIAIEVVNDAPTPINEVVNEPTQLSLTALPQQLTKDEFRQKFSLDDAAYSLAGMSGKPDAGGWLSPGGDRWFISGSRKNRTWSTANPVTSQVVEGKVLSIV